MTETNLQPVEARSFVVEPKLSSRVVSGGTAPTGRESSQGAYVSTVADHARSSREPSTRAAILDALYEERSALTRDRRLSRLTEAGAARLSELEAYIDDIELAEERSAGDAVWRQLERIASRVVAIDAKR